MSPEENRSKNREYHQRWLNKHGERAKAAVRRSVQRWRKAHPEKVKVQQLRRRLQRAGATLEQWSQALNQSNYACEVCGSDDARLCADHDHVTGEFRGVLCVRCNTAFGMLNDDVDKVRALLHYAEAHVNPA